MPASASETSANPSPAKAVWSGSVGSVGKSLSLSDNDSFAGGKLLSFFDSSFSARVSCLRSGGKLLSLFDSSFSALGYFGMVAVDAGGEAGRVVTTLWNR
jgi:hypothetical protein